MLCPIGFFLRSGRFRSGSLQPILSRTGTPRRIGDSASPIRRRGDHQAGGTPTVPLDPPTAWGLCALLVLLGRPLVQAGRGGLPLRAAIAFAFFFALSVQYFLFRWPDWMYAYLVPADRLSPAAVAIPFFALVVAAGAAGAAISLRLLQRGRLGAALTNAGAGIGLWLLLWAATWERYFHLGSYEAFHAGEAIPIEADPAFSVAMAVAGAAQAAVGVGLAAWVVVSVRRLRSGQPVATERG